MARRTAPAPARHRKGSFGSFLTEFASSHVVAKAERMPRRTRAPTIAAELGEVSRFAAPLQLRGYNGMAAKEHSSGQRSWRGGITKTANAHLHRVVTEKQNEERQ